MQYKIEAYGENKLFAQEARFCSLHVTAKYYNILQIQMSNVLFLNMNYTITCAMRDIYA